MVFLLLKVSIPDLNFIKTIKVNSKEYVYQFKEDIIKKCGKNDILLNYGFLLTKDQQPSIFLSEAKQLEDYNIDDKSKLEFVMKRRLNIEVPDSNSNTFSSKFQKKCIEEIQKKLYDKLTERLTKNFDPNFHTETGETPLTLAIQNNDVEAFNILVKNGAIVDYRMNSKYYWMTPLHYSITMRNREMLTLLMKEGACVDEMDSRGYTPLYLAVLNDENEYIKLLTLSSHTFKSVDKDGNGLLHQAINNKNIHVMSLLIDCGTEMNIINKDGNSALHLSVMANNKEMVKKLVTRGCNREIVNNDGKTAKGIAGLKGYTEIFELLTNFNNTMIEPPPPPFEDKEKMIADLLDDSSKFNNAQVLLRKGTLKPGTIKLKSSSSVSSSQQISHNTKKKRKEPPPPPLPLFDLKNLNIDELNDNNTISNSTVQINTVNQSAKNLAVAENNVSATSLIEKSHETINNTNETNKEEKENNTNDVDNNNKEENESEAPKENKENKSPTTNENMLNKKNFEMMVNILYDMLRIINVEEKNVRTLEEYQTRIEGKLARQKYEYSNYKLLKTVDEENNDSNATESKTKI